MSESIPPDGDNVVPFHGRNAIAKNRPTPSNARVELIEYLRSDQFFDKMDALFRPLAKFVERSLFQDHGIDCHVCCSLVDGEHNGKHGPWACYHLDADHEDSHWCFCCSVKGANTMLCTFEGDEPYFTDVVLERHLEAVALTILRDAEQCLGVAKVQKSEKPPPDDPSG